MRKEHEDKLEPDQPTLIVTYGNTTRKHRPLERDVTILGRAPGCDVGLESPEVAPVHCLIVRVFDGWRLRDCSGRLGTRLNGRSVHDELLHDEDVVQVGTFSFKLHLPPASQALAFVPSRQELVATPAAAALTPSRVPVDDPDKARTDSLLERRAAELDQRAENLRALQRDCDEHLALLKQRERECTDRCAALEAERKAFQAQVEKAKRELAASRLALEQEQAAFRAVLTSTTAQSPTSPLPLDLERRRQELDAYAQHLMRTREQVQQQQEELERAREQFRAVREGAEHYDRDKAEHYEQWVQEQEAAAKEYEWRRESLAKEMAELREQRSQIVRMLGELREARRATAPVTG
jgi:pSer/pThr/pTyr-binding forkhead associated (FHA) protein